MEVGGGGAKDGASQHRERGRDRRSLISDGLTGSLDGALAQEERRRNGRTGCLKRAEQSGGAKRAAKREGGGENRGGALRGRGVSQRGRGER